MWGGADDKTKDGPNSSFVAPPHQIGAPESFPPHPCWDGLWQESFHSGFTPGLETGARGSGWGPSWAGGGRYPRTPASVSAPGYTGHSRGSSPFNPRRAPLASGWTSIKKRLISNAEHFTFFSRSSEGQRRWTARDGLKTWPAAKLCIIWILHYWYETSIYLFIICLREVDGICLNCVIVIQQKHCRSLLLVVPFSLSYPDSSFFNGRLL